MADKYLYNNSGTITEKAATVSSAGGANAGQIVALDGSGHLDSTVMPTGIGADTVSVLASEALSAGNFVSLYNNSGTLNTRKADASTTGKKADGFVLGAVSSGAMGTVYLAGQNTQVTGMTPGDVFLSATTPGAATGSAPSGTAGQTVQRIGIALSATVVEFRPFAPIVTG
jgi:hypothetical protein